MAICTSGEKLLQEATGIRRGRVYPVAKNAAYAKSWQVSCKELEKNCPRSRIEVRPTALTRYHARTRWTLTF